MFTRHQYAPTVVTDYEIRCARCNALLAESATRPWQIRCRRCRYVNRRTADARPGIDGVAVTIRLPDAPGRGIDM